MTLAWGARVSPSFRAAASGACARLGFDPSLLMACMAFETGETFSPSIRNAAGSGAVGLIQFMPSTAAVLGTTVEDLAAMSAEVQLVYVERYFAPWARRLANLGDVYGAILWPGMIGKLDSFAVFRHDDPNHPKLYVENRGLDFDADGTITRGEIVRRVAAELARGLMPHNAWNDNAGATT